VAEDYIVDLKRARQELVRQRRLTVSALKVEPHSNLDHQLNTLTRYQLAIEAIDRAITEEQRAAKIAAGVQQPQTRSLHED
jgi:hypothetical protein